MAVLDGIRGPRDLDALDDGQLTVLAQEIRHRLVETVARTSGHLGPNLGVVELTIALHRVFRSPDEPILFDVGHQAYVHKMLTGRAAALPTLRQRGGLSGYPSRAESEHDWIENSHASPALSYADGLSKAFELRGLRRPVVAVVGDGALTGGMCWEALNNIAAGRRPVVIVVNDNGRSYAPTAGAVAGALSALRLRPDYERVLASVKRGLPRVPGFGGLTYRLLHGAKKGVADLLTPHRLFGDLGLKYVGPIDGHNRAAVETALAQARRFDGPVIVHCVTRKGHGYPPAERDQLDHMHQSPGFDVATGAPVPSAGRRWTDVFATELVRIGAERPDVVAVSAAMCEPTGLAEFAQQYPGRFFDVGIAEQHALTSAAGLASGGLHPVVAVYATFLNRAFDQILMDVALHRLPVTIVADRAGVTGPDGPSHHGMWDLAVFGVVPGLRVAAPRDEVTLCDELAEAVGHADGPTMLRFPKTVLPEPMPAVRRVGAVDVLAEPDDSPAADLLLVAVGSMAEHALAAAARVSAAGYRVRVVDPRWVVPVDPTLVDLAGSARLVVTVEDGVELGGVGARIAQTLRAANCPVPTHELGLPTQFLAHGTAAQVRAAAGLDVDTITDRLLGWCAALTPVTPLAAAQRPLRVAAH